VPTTDDLCCFVAASQDVVEAPSRVVHRSGTASAWMCCIRR
jgi:hypothetical protein